jgi:WD40 repeat protein
MVFSKCGTEPGYSASKPVHDHSASALAVSENNRTVVCGSMDSTVSVWSLQDDVRFLHRFLGHKGGVASLALSEHQPLIATGGGDGRTDLEVRVWNLEGYSKLGETGLDEDWALAMTITSDGTRLIVGSLFVVQVFRLPELIEEHAIRLEGSTSGPFVSAYSLAVSKDDLAFVGLEKGEIVVIDVRAGTLDRRWQAHVDAVRFIGLLPDHRLISGSYDGSVKMWHRNGDPLESLRDTGDGRRTR